MFGTLLVGHDLHWVCFHRSDDASSASQSWCRQMTEPSTTCCTAVTLVTRWRGRSWAAAQRRALLQITWILNLIIQLYTNNIILLIVIFISIIIVLLYFHSYFIQHSFLYFTCIRLSVMLLHVVADGRSVKSYDFLLHTWSDFTHLTAVFWIKTLPDR